MGFKGLSLPTRALALALRTCGFQKKTFQRVGEHGVVSVSCVLPAPFDPRGYGPQKMQQQQQQRQQGQPAAEETPPTFLACALSARSVAISGSWASQVMSFVW